MSPLSTVVAARDCPFCDPAIAARAVADYDGTRIIRPKSPVVRGHVLAVPSEHVTDALDDPDITARTVRAAVRYARDQQLTDCNLITSVGRHATQTVFHLHIHVVPRRPRDGLQLPWTRTTRPRLPRGPG